MAERGRVLNLVMSVGDMLSGTVEMRLRCFLSGPDGHAIFKSPFFILTGRIYVGRSTRYVLHGYL